MEIARSTWNHSNANTFLFDGVKYCSLGFYLKSLGYSDDELLYQIYPHYLDNLASLPKWMVLRVKTGTTKVVFRDKHGGIKSSKTVYDMVEVNDSGKKLEKTTKNLFSQIGVKVEYVD